jgi:signal transduction histidine kinase
MQPPDGIRASILIVDDTPANLRLLSQMLADHGFKVRVANSGTRAIEAARANPPDLILLDIIMPDLDGFETCQKLKSDPLTCDIPVIFISALDATNDKLNAFRSGGVDYITKPFQFEEVLARVQTHLALRSLQSQLQITNRELAGKVNELQIQNAELDAFAHTVAHDLKNPLHLIMGYSTLMARGEVDLTTEGSDYAGIILMTARKVNDIIESLLLLAGVRKHEVAFEELDMEQIVQDALATLAPLISDCSGQVILPDAWPTAYGYRPWVEQIWSNYLSNAFKYGGTPPIIRLGAEPFSDAVHLATGKAQVRFWVADNGSGILPEDQKRLFTPFTRIQKDRAQGHGLGLTIVQRIVEKLGGQVGLSSEIGVGSTFFFTLPVS